MVKAKGKLVDEGDIVGDTCLGGQVLEVSDILLETVVHNAIRAFEQFLSELGELEAGSHLGVVGEERGFKVRRKFVKGFLGVGDRGICHLVIPHF